MNDIQIITASAGSGKTYRLTELLEKKIVAGSVRPEAVIATTFTRKAAAELQERVRQRLIAQGLLHQANRLSAARIGTINAICGALIKDFAFEKGLFPETGVLDETASSRELRRSISRVVRPEQTRRLAELDNLLNGFEWSKAVNSLMTQARNNGLEAKGLEESRQFSLQGLEELLEPSLPQGSHLEKHLKTELETFLQQVDTEFDTTNVTREAVETARSVLNGLHQGRPLPWSLWLKLSHFETGKKSKHLAERLVDLAASHGRHPQLKRDLTEAISLVFDIAIQGLSMYQQHKRLWGVMDFADQEALLLDLVQEPYVRERLQGRLDMLLVDEFQDTSPIQLAILLKLAEISRETVWVGDQKQSIYGFRGTDPALMDACLDEMMKCGSPECLETLNKSWRSRPPLVSLTSDIFSRAFHNHQIPEERVRLTPAHTKDDPTLGPAVEWWTLSTKNQEEDALALAEGVRALLQDPGVCVRDKQSRVPRKVKPGDIALLCRTHVVCQKVASALESINIRVVIPSCGLLSTPEIMTVLAGLRLWIDPEDALAAAELARLLHFPDRPDLWLETLLKSPGSKAFKDLPELAAIAEQSKQNRAAGIEQSLSFVCRALDIRKYCLSWGDAAERFANLDSLKAHAATYIDSCFEEGIGCTPAGLIAHLYELQQNEEDTRIPVSGENSVTVSTWHACKGLEWPITILGQIGKTFDPDPLGVKVRHDWNSFSMHRPLADRLLRYWISPYHPRTKNSPFHERLQDHPSMDEITRQHERQELRLLYVGWTRARDRLILAGREKEFETGILSMLRDDQGHWLISPPDGDKATWAGRTFDIQIRHLEPAEPQKHLITPGEDYPEGGPRQFPLERLSPSALSGEGSIESFERIGSRISITGQPDMTALGEALHTYFASDRPAYDPQTRLQLAADILRRWSVSTLLEPEQVLQSSENLQNWVNRQYPEAAWNREYPLQLRNSEGSVISGFIDLLLETPDHLVIIDHKAFPGSRQEAQEKSKEYFGQLGAYAQCIRALHSKPVMTYLHFPILGDMVKVVGFL